MPFTYVLQSYKCMYIVHTSSLEMKKKMAMKQQFPHYRVHKLYLSL